MDREYWLNTYRIPVKITLERTDNPLLLDTAFMGMFSEFIKYFKPGEIVLDTDCRAYALWERLTGAGVKVIGLLLEDSNKVVENIKKDVCEVSLKKTTTSYIGAFDGFICVDVISTRSPESTLNLVRWLYRALKHRAKGLVVAETSTPEEASEAVNMMKSRGIPALIGEFIEAGGYRFKPPENVLRGLFIGAGFEILKVVSKNNKLYMLLRK